MEYTQTIGNVNELKCLVAVMLLGYDCSIPYGNGTKYDFIADINGELLRFQCKSALYVNDRGIIKEDAFRFSTICSTTNTKETVRHRYNSSLIDYFITSFLDKVYVVPVDECSTTKTLRFSPPNNGLSEWNNAEDYLLEKYFLPSKLYSESKEKYLNRNINHIKKKLSCLDCGREISSNAKYCPECYALKNRKVERPDREKLKNLIRTQSFIQIGKLFNVTDNAVRKWCKAYNLPFKVSDIKKITDADWLTI